jgi:hypothetical protein
MTIHASNLYSISWTQTDFYINAFFCFPTFHFPVSKNRSVVSKLENNRPDIHGTVRYQKSKYPAKCISIAQHSDTAIIILMSYNRRTGLMLSRGQLKVCPNFYASWGW